MAAVHIQELNSLCRPQSVLHSSRKVMNQSLVIKLFMLLGLLICSVSLTNYFTVIFSGLNIYLHNLCFRRMMYMSIWRLLELFENLLSVSYITKNKDVMWDEGAVYVCVKVYACVALCVCVCVCSLCVHMCVCVCVSKGLSVICLQHLISQANG